MAKEVAIVTVALGLMLYALLSRPLERSVLTPAILFAALGCLVSPAGLGWVSFGLDNAFVEVLAEIALAVILFGDASRVNFRKLRAGWAVPARLLGIGLPLTVLAGWGRRKWSCPSCPSTPG